MSLMRHLWLAVIIAAMVAFIGSLFILHPAIKQLHFG